MRRRATVSLLSFMLAGAAAAIAAPAHEPVRGRAGPGLQSGRPSGPPHAWLYGIWTGGLFPVLEGMEAQDCRTQPTVAFAQDVVSHSSLTGAGMTPRVIETVRTSPGGADFRFSPESNDPGAFGCSDLNVLHVAREGNDRISFPNCAAFPYPLHRCPAPAR